MSVFSIIKKEDVIEQSDKPNEKIIRIKRKNKRKETFLYILLAIDWNLYCKMIKNMIILLGNINLIRRIGREYETEKFSSLHYFFNYYLWHL